MDAALILRILKVMVRPWFLQVQSIWSGREVELGTCPPGSKVRVRNNFAKRTGPGWLEALTPQDVLGSGNCWVVHSGR